jgi:hypothetical protein
MDLAQVSAVCDAAMREYGVPERIRTDNAHRSLAQACWDYRSYRLAGPSSASCARQATTDGRHERMHRTLKEDTTKPPARTLTAQQKSCQQRRYKVAGRFQRQGRRAAC